MLARRKTRAPPPIALPANHDNFGPLAANCCDLFRRRHKWSSAIRTDRAFSAFVDQEHTLRLLSFERCKRTVFRAAIAQRNATAARPGAKPPCLSPFSACVAGHFLSCERPDNA